MWSLDSYDPGFYQDFGTVSGCPEGSRVRLARARPGVQTLAIYLSFPGKLFCIPFADFVFNYRIIVHSVCKTNGRLTPLAASFQGLHSWFTVAHRLVQDTFGCLFRRWRTQLHLAAAALGSRQRSEVKFWCAFVRRSAADSAVFGSRSLAQMIRGYLTLVIFLL